MSSTLPRLSASHWNWSVLVAVESPSDSATSVGDARDQRTS